MQRKKILEHPWIIPPSLPKGKKSELKAIEYLAAVALIEIKDKSHLIIDVYEKDKKENPKVRLSYIHKEYCQYWPKEEKWRVKKYKADFGGFRKNTVDMAAVNYQKCSNFQRKSEKRFLNLQQLKTLETSREQSETRKKNIILK